MESKVSPFWYFIFLFFHCHCIFSLWMLGMLLESKDIEFYFLGAGKDEKIIMD